MASRARVAAKKAREATRRKSPFDSFGFASKLSDCRTKDPAVSELFIVEGNPRAEARAWGGAANFKQSCR